MHCCNFARILKSKKRTCTMCTLNSAVASAAAPSSRTRRQSKPSLYMELLPFAGRRKAGSRSVAARRRTTGNMRARKSSARDRPRFIKVSIICGIQFQYTGRELLEFQITNAVISDLTQSFCTSAKAELQQKGKYPSSILNCYFASGTKRTRNTQCQCPHGHELPRHSVYVNLIIDIQQERNC